MRRVTILAVTAAAALALAACGESPEDEAHEDGEQVGEAVRAMFDATSADQARAAADDLRSAADGLGEDAREHVRDQVEAQGGTLENAAEAFTEGDTAEFRSQIQQVRAQADAFASGNDSVANAFWRGFEDGYDN